MDVAAVLQRDDIDEHFAGARLRTTTRGAAVRRHDQDRMGGVTAATGRGDRREARTLVDAGLGVAVAAEAGAIEARAREVIDRYF